MFHVRAHGGCGRGRWREWRGGRETGKRKEEMEAPPPVGLLVGCWKREGEVERKKVRHTYSEVDFFPIDLSVSS